MKFDIGASTWVSSKEELASVVEKVGNSAAAVRKELGTR